MVRKHLLLLIAAPLLSLSHCSFQPDNTAPSWPTMTEVAVDTMYGDGDSDPVSDPLPQDLIPPIISWTGPDTIIIAQYDPDNVLAYYISDTAFQAEDPQGGAVEKMVAYNVDITSVTDTSPLYQIIYSAHDEAGNYASAVRYIRVVAGQTALITPPVIVCPDTIFTCVGVPPDLSVFKAIDVIDGRIENVILTGAADITTPGSYPLIISATDSRGYVGTKTCMVIVRECPLSVKPRVIIP